MAIVAKPVLLDRVISALQEAGATVVQETTDHPFDLIIMIERPHRARVYIWNVSHGGGQARPETEYRFQITGVSTPLGGPPGSQTLLLGWHEDLEVFVAADAGFHREPGSSPSVQISLATLQRASVSGAIAAYRRGNGEVALGLPPKLLAAYVVNQRAMHDIASEQELVALLEQASAGATLTRGTLAALPPERQRVLLQLSVNARDSSFRRRVMEAYQDACAVCGLQFGLVDAAHIVPVEVRGSTDETANGIALCALHHRAYDNGILGVLPDGSIRLSEDKLAALRESGLDAGAASLRGGLRPIIALPDNLADRPLPEYLTHGLELRGWGD
jgi:putative restriction endonuclease